ncbi:MAG: YlbF family regulator [Alicyclobacillus sp.]|nr:YlbF family regulator [Alicyclobacillus sp.]
MFDHNELWAQTEELADLIMQSPEISAYQQAEARMKQHPQAGTLLAKLKEVQEQVAEFQARQVPPMHYVHLLKESESLLAQLEKIPEVAEFQRAQNAVNDLLQTLTRRLARAVLERVGDDAEEDG